MNLRILFFLSFFVFSFWSCKTSDPEVVDGDYVIKGETVYYKGPKSNDLVVQIASEPPSLHPTNSRTASRSMILGLVYQRLMSLDVKDGSLIPDLCAQNPVRSEDGLSYTYELAADAAWPDGAPVTNEDVLFSIKAMACPLVDNLNQRAYTEFVKDVKPDPGNDRKFVVEMTEYYINNDNFGIFTFILDPRKFDPEGILANYSLDALLNDASIAENTDLKGWADFFNGLNFRDHFDILNSGSGLYKMDEWIPEQRIILSRNENYWGKGKEGEIHAQHPDKIIFKFLRDDNALELQIKQQEIDVTTMLTTQSYDNLKDNEGVKQNYHIGIRTRDSYAFLLLNNRPDGIKAKKFFDDKKVRQALAHAIPIKRLIDEIYPETATQTTSAVSSVNKDFNEKITPFPFDPEKAKSLLDEAGWTDSDGDLIRDKVIDGQKTDFSFNLFYPPSGQDMEDLVQEIKESLRLVGIACNLDPQGMATAVPNIRNQSFDAGLMALSSSPLPYDFKQLFHSTNWPNGDNFFGFNNQEADELIDQSRVEQDPVKRKEMVDRLQEIIYDEQPCIFMFNPTKKMAIHRRFNNADMYAIRDHVILNNLEMIRWEE